MVRDPMTILRTGTEAAGSRRLRPARAAAFTLIELLVVMGIIGVLVGILLPAVNRVVVTVRNAACASRIAQIHAGLENFKNDWGVYPPSNRGDEDADRLEQNCPGSEPYGKELLTVALVGPNADAKGWGRPVEGVLPFGDLLEESVAYGPYYQGEFEWDSEEARIPDAFPSPERPILYYRYDRGDSTYRADDNPSGEGLGEGFQSEDHFELSAKYLPPDVTNWNNAKWQRKDYLLIAAGHDRMYGWVVEDQQTGDVRAATQQEVEDGTATCDDLTNFGD